MKGYADRHYILKNLPGVDHILELVKDDEKFNDIPRSVIVEAVRSALDKARKDIIADRKTEIDLTYIILETEKIAREKTKPRLVNLINATGVILHTNLGRAPLCKDALENIKTIARSYSNLEFNIRKGKRGIRYEAVDQLICELTGAQGAIVVNNNAGAVLLALNTLAKDREVAVSRGELVEIGGSFRIPEIMSKSGCILKEVGTTNRTHLRDYENAISDKTGLFLKVHTSNYKIQGFTSEVGLKDLAGLGEKTGIPLMEDLGSGTLTDLSKYGPASEPAVADSISSGADLVTFSGDKLIGGPQAGIITGEKSIIDKIKKNPLARALRIDKLTLAALESTLKLYRDEEKAVREIPVLRMLTMPFEEVSGKAELLLKAIKEKTGSLSKPELADLDSRPGGGSFPELNIPTRCVTVQPGNMSVSKFEIRMRTSSPPVIGRIDNGRYIIDPRTLQEGEEEIISATIAKILLKK